MGKHVCEPPRVNLGGMIARAHPWACGICGRVFAITQWGWEEVQGPDALSRRRQEEKRLRLALSASNLGTGVLVERLASLRKQLDGLVERWRGSSDPAAFLVKELSATLNPEQETP